MLTVSHTHTHTHTQRLIPRTRMSLTTSTASVCAAVAFCFLDHFLLARQCRCNAHLFLIFVSFSQKFLLGLCRNAKLLSQPRLRHVRLLISCSRICFRSLPHLLILSSLWSVCCVAGARASKDKTESKTETKTKTKAKVEAKEQPVKVESSSGICCVLSCRFCSIAVFALLAHCLIVYVSVGAKANVPRKRKAEAAALDANGWNFLVHAFSWMMLLFLIASSVARPFALIARSLLCIAQSNWLVAKRRNMVCCRLLLL